MDRTFQGRLAPQKSPAGGPKFSPATFRQVLLRWYDLNRRVLPWRKTGDPYRVWVSEIMLQQTRVTAVLEHYRIFLKRFPSIRALANASESAVLAVWSGLGYYRRARLMRLCAQEIVEKHSGRFPRIAEQLRSLPGVGRYTAAAIASIACGEPVAVVDGNVERVLARLSGHRLSGKEQWGRAQELVSHARPGDYNQAIMELGATVCTPRQPKCLACPVQRWCATKGESPWRTASDRQDQKEIWCSLAQRDGEVRLVQRAQNSSLMAGMWELPQRSKAPRSVRLPWRSFRHSITNTDYTVHVIRHAANGRGLWVPVDRLSEMPITGLTRKILKAARII